MVGLVGCFLDGDSGFPWHQPKSESATSTEPPFHARLLEIAACYESYNRVDVAMRWAPALCSPNPGPSVVHLEGRPQLSTSGDTETHGRKLYALFVKKLKTEMKADSPFLQSYTRAGQPNPVGQVIVKEAWLPEEVDPNVVSPQSVTRKVKVRQDDGTKWVDVEYDWVPYTEKLGHLYHAKEKSALFIMYKLDPKTPGTDEGWVYGTVTADGKQVTSAGRVAACMKCHQDAPHDRLFGLKPQ
jgi:hypothetical protein